MQYKFVTIISKKNYRQVIPATLLIVEPEVSVLYINLAIRIKSGFDSLIVQMQNQRLISDLQV